MATSALNRSGIYHRRAVPGPQKAFSRKQYLLVKMLEVYEGVSSFCRRRCQDRWAVAVRSLQSAQRSWIASFLKSLA